MVSDASSMAFDHESVTLPLSHPRPLHLFVSLSFCIIHARASLPNSVGGNSNSDVLDWPSSATAGRGSSPHTLPPFTVTVSVHNQTPTRSLSEHQPLNIP